ncbi:spermatogenesis-associated protein 20-like isoform X3 [Penaeus japonicus]|uniref:spermatogenesis-associated protein 20-like isoform X3 n=1 Tax=Penaeus japonicus TaxID=27405 RepID=UPI001C71150F|nr:spermatogenesis-associated protein 20-like isoform X3 [Penaeus japonicus]
MNFYSFGRWISRVSQHPITSSFWRTMATAGEGSASDGPGKLNRLASEKSPYLLQHAGNPVDWFPWGEEAFNEAKKENKLIFLSVGYSTCHWCHVMERESFENPDIAKIMNANFINVKVDREERPDVDKVYMTFVTAASGRGGWPMSVFLTPDLVPVAGGTYFPPEDRFGRIGFGTVLNSLSQKWKEDEGKFKESGKKIMEVLDRTSRLSLSAHSDLPGEEAIARCYAQLSRSYEPQYGGFGESPKFPQPANFNFLFTYYALNPDQDDAKKSLEMAIFTLKKMDQGGIHDHVAQGFARYSTDERWHVPHFEKMLYDQAQLTCSFLDAYVITGQSRFAEVVRDILTYVTRDLSHPCGGFYSAEDADSLPTPDAKEKREGAFCVWTYEEINQHLAYPVKEGHDATLANLFCHHYSVVEGGNVNPYQDPHDELKNQNVLIEHCTIEETGEEFDLSEEECKAALSKACQILYDIRQKRPRPHLDNKMLTSWNGMMLGAMARAGAVLGEKAYIERAIQAADFVKTYLYKDGLLLRSAYSLEDSQVSVGSSLEGFVDDYAWMVRGFLNLYEATLDTLWLELAEELQDKENELFWDTQEAGYFMTKEGDSSILLRIKEDQDGAEPSANSVSVGNLLRLSPLLDRADYKEKAEAIFRLFAERLNKIPIALPEMTTALLIHNKPPVQIILAGNKGTDATQKMLQVVHGRLIPSRVIMLADENHESLLYNRHSSLRHYHPKKPNETIAHVCQNFRCSLPVNNPEQLEETLNNPSFVGE